ncbi:hypothetical protein BJN34_04640 [Cupriavidus necator]|uniref:Integrase n=2 Tax=Cupriavidus necator TaxID=106590 RepID=A0A1U9UKF0_CUPNE|nr:hypothetical protein BJN34_04640 [Cupriavidus necator]
MTTPGSSAKLGWDFLLPDGTESMDVEHTILLESFRVVFWGMLENGRWYGKQLKPGSAAPFGVGMRDLFRWMIFRGFSSFSDLNAEVQAQYLSDLPLILTRRSQFYGGIAVQESDTEVADFEGDDEEASESFDEEAASETEDGEDDGLSYHQAANRVNTLYFIYGQKDALLELGLPAMETKPFGARTAGEVAGELSRYVINRVPPLPDEVALPLIREALNWIEEKSHDVLNLQDLYINARKKALGAGLSDSRASTLATAALCSYEFRKIGDKDDAWREPIVGEEVFHPEHGETFHKPTQVLRTLVLRLRDACIITLQYLVGLRVSEVCSPKVGEKREEELPDCIVRRYSKSGVMELFFLKGILSKGVKQPREDEWLLGCRPAGSTHLPATVRAIVILELLFRPWRNLGEVDDLIVGFSQPKSLPQSRTSISPIRSAQILRGQKHFIFSQVNLSELPDRNERGEDLAMYRESKGLCIRTHQGRKTFASYMLESRTSLLMAVSQHFKHMDSAMTESAYFPSITRQRDEAEASRTAETIAFFVEAIQGRPIFGRMADLIKKYFSGEEWRNISEYSELDRKVGELVRVHDLRIFFADHGKCCIKANPLESRCRDASGGASWAADTPDYSARTPSMCAGCGCFAVDASNLPFWKRRYENLSVVLQQDSSAHVTREFRVHRLRTDQARKMVTLLEGGVAS